MLAFDEITIRECLVFEKVTGEIMGFVDYGEESLDVRFIIEIQRNGKLLLTC